MQVFKDRLARDWAIEITVASANRVKAALDVNLYALAEDGLKPLFALLADVPRFVSVLFVLCRKQAAEAFPGKDEGELAELFADGLAGDALDLAGETFCEAYLDFFPNRAARPGLRKALVKVKELGTLLAAKAETEIDTFDPARLLASSNEPSGKTPESSASTPAPSPSDNSP